MIRNPSTVAMRRGGQGLDFAGVRKDEKPRGVKVEVTVVNNPVINQVGRRRGSEVGDGMYSVVTEGGGGGDDTFLHHFHMHVWPHTLQHNTRSVHQNNFKFCTLTLQAM